MASTETKLDEKPSAVADPPEWRAMFELMERHLEQEPEGIQGEIVQGVYLMSPRPRRAHGRVQARLAAVLINTPGNDWDVIVEPELQSKENYSRLVPDLAAWRAGTPDLETTPVDEPMPEWVAEVLSPSTERTDRGLKLEAYGAMGINVVWLVDIAKRRVETYANVEGKMVPGPVLSGPEPVDVEPFKIQIRPAEIFGVA